VKAGAREGIVGKTPFSTILAMSDCVFGGKRYEYVDGSTFKFCKKLRTDWDIVSTK